MIDAVYYDVDGLILAIIQFEDDATTEEIDAEAPEDTVGWIDSAEADIDTDYIVAGVLTPKPTLYGDTKYLLAPDGQEYTIIANMPIGTTVYDISADTTETTTVVEDLIFSTIMRGKWEISVSPPFPYRTQIIEVTTNVDY